MSAAAGARRGTGQHGIYPLSPRTQRRVLNALVERALAGDPAAAEAYLRVAKEAGQQAAGEPARSVPAGSDTAGG